MKICLIIYIYLCIFLSVLVVYNFSNIQFKTQYNSDDVDLVTSRLNSWPNIEYNVSPMEEVLLCMHANPAEKRTKAKNNNYINCSYICMRGVLLNMLF